MLLKLTLAFGLTAPVLHACPEGDPTDQPDEDPPTHNGSCAPVLSPACTTLAADAENFCDAMATLAESHGLSDMHAALVDESCAVGRPLCDTCALLQAYCDQDGTACTDLEGLCSCVGEAFDVP